MLGSAATVDPEFALSLYRRLDREPGNVFFSPYSIASALTMVQAGARGAARAEIETVLAEAHRGERLIEAMGTLRRELESRADPTALEVGQLEDPRAAPAEAFGCHLTSVDALWHQSGYAIRPDFAERLRRQLGAEVADADFASDAGGALARINAWASGATLGKIRDVLAPGMISALTRVILANAIHFKARWATPFSQRATKAARFTLLNGGTADVPTMVRQQAYLKSARDGALQALELPYSGDKVAMILLLPDAGTFEHEQASLDAARLERVIRSLTPEFTNLSLPRFRIDSSFELRSALESLGISTAFAPGADFTSISPEPGFRLDEMIHTTYVDVNELGTEAAAVTLSRMVGAGPPSNVVEFHCDRPFLFLIRDMPTGIPLFMGRVVDPR